MPMRRWPVHHRVRVLGISLLILSLVHAPWPKADFHNVRHHDAPGQVCEHHDHLLRWHPDAGLAKDVAILHWHWFLPTSDPSGPGHTDNGPALHAYVSGWDATSPDAGPLVVSDSSSRPLDPLPSSSPIALGDIPFARGSDRLGLCAGLASPKTFGATFAPRISLASRLQRWSC
jgi:hypothetical protein